MNLNRFDLNLLLALDALLHARNVTNAAARIGMSQPAMSAALARLRDYFGDPLLSRAGRELCLTPRGLALLEPVREALLKIGATLSIASGLHHADIDREFVVMFRNTLVPELVPALVRAMQEDAPRARLRAEPVSPVSLKQLDNGDADLAMLLDDPRRLGMEALPDWARTQVLRNVNWVCVVCRDHPDIGDELGKESYLALPHVLASPQGAGLSLTELLRRFGLPHLNVRATVQDPAMLPFLVPGTRLIATLPESVARRVVPLLPIRIFPHPLQLPARTELMVWHRRNEGQPEHQWLRAKVLQAAGLS